MQRINKKTITGRSLDVDKMEIEQSFHKDEKKVKRVVRIGKDIFKGYAEYCQPNLDLSQNYFISSLNQITPNISNIDNGRLTYVDLFCGGGGLSYGAHEALKFLGFNPKLLAASDLDGVALELISKHFSPLIRRQRSVEDLVKFAVDHTGTVRNFITQPTMLDKELEQFKGKINLLVGGPPCQGHSNLNNKTRRHDPRNRLYYVMPALATALDIPCVLIENVPSIKSSHEDVVTISTNIFKEQGYNVQEIILTATDFGVAQSRSRHFLLATKAQIPDLSSVANALKVKHLTFDDVTKDMPELDFENHLLQGNGNLSDQNIDRINFLHDNNLHDLPNANRPVCHQEGNTYQSVYGRIHGGKPMCTITTGFGSPGRGRYIHPYERRVINIREASRVQSFPDHYWKHTHELNFLRSNFAKIIGDAVPPLMVFPLIVALYNALKLSAKKKHRTAS